MEPNPPVFEISSDEESAFDDPIGCDDDYKWLTDLLGCVEKHLDDSDDVVVVGEYNPPAKIKSKFKSSEPVKGVVEDNEDDCVVLEGDPDCPVAVEKCAGSDDDDVLVVGQKGQIACRDYPHPRHHCAKYPFISTPHTKHCDLCHCYVCDLLAPCKHWGMGDSNIDHCHATDKEPAWKTQRENFRKGKVAPPPVSKSPDTPLSSGLLQLNQVASSNIIRLTPNSIPQNQICRPSTIRACSSNMNGPNNINQSRHRRSPYAPVRNGFLPQSVSQQALGARHTGYIRSNRGCNTRNLNQRFVSYNAMFKRPGIIKGSSAVNQSTNGSSASLTVAPTSQDAMNVGHLATLNNRSPAGQQNLGMNLQSCAYSQINMASSTLNTIPSQSAACSRPIDPILWSSGDQNISQLGNQSGNVTNLEFSDFDFGGVFNNVSQSNEPSSVEDIQLHGLGSNDEQPANQPLSTQFTSSTQLHPKDPDYQGWLVGESDPLAPEVYAPVDPNLFPPQPPVVDDGMLLFDFETSWMV